MIKLKELRTQKGCNQTDVAKVLGITQQAYANYETEKRQPDHETLTKLADFFNVSVDYLLGRTDVPQNGPASLSEEEAELLQQYRSLDEQGKSKVDEYLSDCLRLYGLVRQELPNGYAITTNRHEIPPAVLEEAEALRKKHS